MRTLIIGLALTAALCASCKKAETPRAFSQAALDQALADPGRKAQRDAADERRKPGPLIALAGVKRGDKVLDLIPGSGYWTRIFSKIVGPEGKVYAVWPQAYARFSMGNVQDMRKLSADKYYGNIVTEVQPSAILSAPELLDVVWTSQNYHDYPDEYMGKDADPGLLNKAVFKILKPGGTYMIIDHMAKPGRGMADTEALHRIDPAIVRRQVEAVGFQFAGESKVLNNPNDPLDIPVFDKSIRGHTSQFAYKFVKP
ncbi:class I SAM-dependent methyltransferase [Sphingomonas sp. URHD0057]|uniref:class I SAM-dependent methyltransferase n=1 Tax=Sphingomonas sp. URHD0057 TaxID=1380389 RepID=UPI00048E18FC|nr:class I SAM-dependent methyltransferase [Sphingomonas sp. URHD0057]